MSYVQRSGDGVQDQDMSDTYTGKIKRVLNGYTAFAEVTVRLDESQEGQLGGVSIECGEGTDMHRAGAVMGVCFALRQMEIDYAHFSITNIKLTMVDTTPVHCMIAAARAVWSWADDDWQTRYIEDDDYLLDLVRTSHENPRANVFSIPMLHQ